MNTYIKKKKTKKIIGVLSIIIIFILLAFAFYTGLTVKHYTVITSKVSDDSNIRIVLLSDLHSCIYGENQMGALHRFQNNDTAEYVLFSTNKYFSKWRWQE